MFSLLINARNFVKISGFHGKNDVDRKNLRKEGSWLTETDISPKPEQLGNNADEEQDRDSKSSRKMRGLETHGRWCLLQT